MKTLLLLLLFSLTYSQVDHLFSGYVISEDGRPIQSVQITLETGEQFYTNKYGYYKFYYNKSTLSVTFSHSKYNRSESTLIANKVETYKLQEVIYKSNEVDVVVERIISNKNAIPTITTHVKLDSIQLISTSFSDVLAYNSTANIVQSLGADAKIEIRGGAVEDFDVTIDNFSVKNLYTGATSANLFRLHSVFNNFTLSETPVLSHDNTAYNSGSLNIDLNEEDDKISAQVETGNNSSKALTVSYANNKNDFRYLVGVSGSTKFNRETFSLSDLEKPHIKYESFIQSQLALMNASYRTQDYTFKLTSFYNQNQIKLGEHESISDNVFLARFVASKQLSEKVNVEVGSSFKKDSYTKLNDETLTRDKVVTNVVVNYTSEFGLNLESSFNNSIDSYTSIQTDYSTSFKNIIKYKFFDSDFDHLSISGEFSLKKVNSGDFSLDKNVGAFFSFDTRKFDYLDYARVSMNVYQNSNPINHYYKSVLNLNNNETQSFDGLSFDTELSLKNHQFKFSYYTKNYLNFVYNRFYLATNTYRLDKDPIIKGMSFFWKRQINERLATRIGVEINSFNNDKYFLYRPRTKYFAAVNIHSSEKLNMFITGVYSPSENYNYLNETLQVNYTLEKSTYLSYNLNYFFESGLKLNFRLNNILKSQMITDQGLYKKEREYEIGLQYGL